MTEPNVVQIQSSIQDHEKSRPNTEQVTFDDFWLLFPRKVAKLAARKAWARIDPALYPVIVTACAAWRPVWADKDPEYIPHPATWLNGERWEDELPRGFTPRPQQTAPNGPTIADHPVQARTPLPEHVRALLCRLKAKL